MPDRIVRAGILSSDAVNALSWPGEVFYRRLFSVVDDFGRFDARPTYLRSQLYPLKIDRVSDSDVGKWLTECVTAGLVRAYQVSGKPYLEVVKFDQRKRADVSKWPDPPTSDGASPSNDSGRQQKSALVVDEIEDEDGVEVVSDESALLAAYHSLLPSCQQVHVLNDKRKRRIADAVKLAKKVCASQGWAYRASEFWHAYFTECSGDAWMRGEVPNPKNPSWKQNLDVLLAEDRFASVMDRAITAMKESS